MHQTTDVGSDAADTHHGWDCWKCWLYYLVLIAFVATLFFAARQ